MSRPSSIRVFKGIIFPRPYDLIRDTDMPADKGFQLIFPCDKINPFIMHDDATSACAYAVMPYVLGYAWLM